MLTDLRTQPYVASVDHLMAELERLDLLIRNYVATAREARPQEDPYQGLYISDTEFETLMAGPAGLPPWARTPSARLDAALRHIEQVIAGRIHETVTRGGTLRLVDLRTLFGLSALDIDILLICTAPELDLRYERIFAYLQDDVTKRHSGVDLVLNVLCASFTEKLQARARLGPDAPLRRHGLIEIFDDPGHPRPSLLGQYLKLDPRILAFLLGNDEIDERLKRFARCVMPADTVPQSPDDLLARAIALHRANSALVLHLHGPRGVGKKTAAANLCARLGLTLMLIDGAAIAAAEKDRFGTLARIAIREATLQDAALCWTDIDMLFNEEHRPSLTWLMEMLEEAGRLAVLVGTRSWDVPVGRAHPNFSSLELPAPDTGKRIELWAQMLDGDGLSWDESAALATTFRFTAGEIAAALAAARARARARCPTVPTLTPADLYACCRERSSPKLGELARKVGTHQGWHDLVLPADSMRQLHEICARVKHRADVMEGWGFDGKLTLGKGLSVLFAGPSGTGKTMAAGIMAAELSLDLFRIDLSSVVSKYIGDTEKNISSIFAEAEASSAILFFDEADALFGKRSEVKDAHDRHANIETSYLLQRMEEYEGISILATNLRRNMDDAFTRRLTFIVQFPAPEAVDRRRIWQGVFPDATPLAEDLDFDYMARQFKLSGGNIKNIAIAAAFLAASEARTEGQPDVAMSHLVRATRRELHKLGRIAGSGDFAEYAHLLEEGLG